MDSQTRAGSAVDKKITSGACFSLASIVFSGSVRSRCLWHTVQ
jgi:hypothetical protein